MIADLHSLVTLAAVGLIPTGASSFQWLRVHCFVKHTVNCFRCMASEKLRVARARRYCICNEVVRGCLEV